MESRMCEQLLSEGAETSILLQKGMVLSLEFLGLVGPGREFAFELANVFYAELARVLGCHLAGRTVPFLLERKARAETLFRSWRRSLLLSFLPSSLLSRRSSSSMSSSSFLFLMM